MTINVNNYLRSLIAAMEDDRIPFYFLIASFFAVLVLRFIGEGYSQPQNFLNSPSSLGYWWFFLHTVVGYIALGLGLVAIFQLTAKVTLEQAARLMLAGYIVIFITPLLDLLLGIVTELSTRNFYIHPNKHVDVAYAYWTVFGRFSGMSVGLRTEIISIIIGLFFYFRIKGRQVITSIALSWLCYSWIFFLACSPLVLSKLLTMMDLPYQYTSQTMIFYYSFIALLFGGWFWLAEKKYKITISYIWCIKALFVAIFILAGIYFVTHIKQLDLSREANYAIGLHFLFLIVPLLLLEINNSKAHIVAILVAGLTNTDIFYFVLLYALISLLADMRNYLEIPKAILLFIMGYGLAMSALHF